MSKPALILWAVALALAPLARPSAEISTRPQQIDERMDTASEMFVKTARIAGAFEVESSKLALKRSQNSDIRAFAERMVTDHSKAREQLDETARKENVIVPEPTSTDKMVKKHLQLLATLRGADDAQFDRLYVQMQVVGHNQVLQLFAAYAKKGDNEALKTFAQETLPVLLDHWKSLEGLNAS